MRRSRSALLTALPLVLLAACGEGGPAPYAGNVPHPAGDAVVVRVEWAGGFVPYESIFTSLPNFTLLGDGRVIVQGPVIEIYPGPSLPNLQVRQLTEEGVQSVLFRIAETGLFQESQSFNAATQFIADANSTIFTVSANDRLVVVDVYALGFLTDDAGSPGTIPQAEREAHATLAELDADLQNLESWISPDDWATPAWEAYQPEALRLLVGNIDNEPPNPDGLDSDPVPWPGPTPPDQLGEASQVQDLRCGVVSGNEAATWLEALASANQLTRWSADGHLYRVTPRPLLPDESLDCRTFTS
jgi:hypothetical protein